MTSRLGLRVLALALPAVLLAPAAAHAERVVTRDAAGDVVGMTADFANSSGEGVAPAPQNSSADIVRTVVDHRAEVLTLVVTLRDLRPAYGDSVLARIKTPRGAFAVLSERHGRRTFTMMIGRGDLVECGGLRTTVDATSDQVRITVPTSCLRDPGWVRVGLIAGSTEIVHDPEVGDLFEGSLDDAHAGAMESDTRDPAFGPKVRRG